MDLDTLVTELHHLDPVEAARRLRPLGDLSFLDSAMQHAALGRYSFVAARPFATIIVRDGVAAWNGQVLPGPPLEAMRRALAPFSRARIAGLPPFQGGAIGFFSYDFGGLLEHPPRARLRGGAGPEAAFHVYDWAVAFDHVEGRAWLIATGLGGAPAARTSAEILALLGAPALVGAETETALAWRAHSDRAAHVAAVARTVEYVLAGDIFQANIAQRFSAPLPPRFSPFDYYRRLRAANPAPFAAFLDFGGIVLASSSPERFLTVSDGRAEARPIKGTAPRAMDAEADARQALALSQSVKDRAENVMIVDLLRNDLSRVCRPGSVDVPVLCGIESYAGLHHLVSVVTGELGDGQDCFDLVRAAFPGGSVTGAPKIRAMDIIAELEGSARGPYCGAMGYFGFDGAMDFNIAIRTVVFADREAHFHAGGGITALSAPEAEYEETLLKASRVLTASDPA